MDLILGVISPVPETDNSMLDMKTRLIENMEIMYIAIRFPHSKEIALWKRVSAFLHLLRVPTRVAAQGVSESQENAK